MSRYNKFLKRGSTDSVAYGFDNATGYFFQVFEGVDEHGLEILTVDECSLFTKMSNARMIELMTEYDADQDHIDLVSVDLPF